ncbi:hypothetical protein HCN44_010247 [Aphidius gifuensis]|uniref:SAC3/GANP/THP3 conserved domain-containing protein n=1 Tax=Aphidius gifuensis TaxID=684658 RepID=A0A834XXV3_APHGI|nr:SAC3 domain-containing protein 1 [Aphidius gifuensis]KAF7993652.1 hypothetical protein HCN44_010247 [Aphidius gifuensis]
MDVAVIGRCFSMCPEKERIMREREGLLHVLEIDEKTKNQKRPKCDPSKIVKCYSRPSAGMFMTDPNQLRPGPVLMVTLRYLLSTVVTRTDVKWSRIYEFVFDRIRAIRQDIVIQMLDIPTSIRLFEPIVKFYIYSNERLCEKSLNEFVPKFNNEHLLECIKQLLVMYDEYEQYNVDKSSMENNCRTTIEVLYILLHLGDQVALRRGLNLPKKYREEPYIKKALKISLACHVKNYARVCREIRKLPSLFSIAAIRNLQYIRRDTFEIMSCSYNSQKQTFSAYKLKEILLYEDLGNLKRDCDLFGFNFNNGNVAFENKKFNRNILNAHPEQHIPDETLHSFLPAILLSNENLLLNEKNKKFTVKKI